MRSEKETYEVVANACSAYAPAHSEDTYKACNGDCCSHCPSCLNCSHFAPEEFCRLDLYDQIADNI